MSKVKVTKEQAEAIEKESYRDYENILYDYLVVSNYDEKFKGLTFGGLYRALHQGYEVEPEFKKGDFVVWHGLVVEIKHPQTNDHKDDGRCYFTLERSDGSTYENITRDEIRHATPAEIAEEKERRFFAKHGRELWELREDDILKYLGDVLIVDSFDSEEVCFKSNASGAVVYTKNFNFVTDNFKFVAFAEDRLDVKTNA